MKKRKLEKIIREYFPTNGINFTSFDKYDSAELVLIDGGIVSIGIEPKTRKTSSFLYFNIRYSDIRLLDSNKHNGKINYFGEDAEDVLHDLLKELQGLLNN